VVGLGRSPGATNPSNFFGAFSHAVRTLSTKRNKVPAGSTRRAPLVVRARRKAGETLLRQRPDATLSAGTYPGTRGFALADQIFDLVVAEDERFRKSC